MTMKPASYRDALAKILTVREMRDMIFGFDILGDMALIEVPEGLAKKSTKIARTLLDTHPYLTRVYEKVGSHSGKYRVEKTRWLAGAKNPVVTAKEWGCIFRVHPGEVYYSPRLGTERQRIASEISPRQAVAVFFAGAGPFPILIAKHARPSRVLAIEWNPNAIPFLKENISLNKVGDMVEAKKGDVGKLVPSSTFDHVVMPAPDTAVDYLPSAMKWISPRGGFIHLYTFVPADEMEVVAQEKVNAALGKSSRKWKIASIRKVNDFSPTKRQVCVKIHVLPSRSPASRKKRTIKKA